MSIRHTSLILFAFKTSYLVLAATIILVVGLELGARLLLPDLVKNWRSVNFGNNRVIFVSEGAFENAAGYFRYSPNRQVREVAYFPDEENRFTREYDCTYFSDHLGFVSNSIDYQDAEIVILGDSFTQGVGGCPWIPRLTHGVRSRVYSVAIMGHGVKHWQNILTDLEKLKKPTKILIIFITHDFVRTDWVFDESQLRCLSDRKTCLNNYWFPISDRMNNIAAKRYALRKSGRLEMGQSKFIKYHLIASHTLIEKLKATGHTERKSDRINEAVEIIFSLANRYPVKMIWVNQKHEVGKPAAETLRLWRKLKGLDLTRCNIPLEGFLRRDNHPNSIGYEMLKNCVEKVVRSW